MRVPYYATLFSKVTEQYFNDTLSASCVINAQTALLLKYPPHDFTITDVRPYKLKQYVVISYDGTVPYDNGVVINSFDTDGEALNRLDQLMYNTQGGRYSFKIMDRTL